MAELQGQQTNPANNSTELLEIVYHEATGRSDTNFPSKAFLLCSYCVTKEWIPDICIFNQLEYSQVKQEKPAFMVVE